MASADDRSAASAATPQAARPGYRSPPLYAAVHGAPPHPLEAGAGLALARAISPFFALAFAGRLAGTFARLNAHPAAPSLRPEAAFAALGRSLTIRIDPGAVTYRLPDRVSDGARVLCMTERFLDAGDWSTALTPLAQDHVWEEVHELVAAEYDWRATRSYRRAKKAAQRGEPVIRNGRPLASQDQVVAYFRRNLDLVRSIAKHGLLDRNQARPTFDRPSHGPARLPAQEWSERNVGVAIDQDGSLLRLGPGRHRWAAARALGLLEAPVEIRLVHVAWLEHAIAETGLEAAAALRSSLARLQAAQETG